MKTTKEINTKLLNADVYRLLASCFDFPNEERLFAIREISEGLGNTGYPDNEIQNMILTLRATMDEEEILRDYSVIFIKGGVPLNESHTLKKYNSVADVNAFYSAFGFSPRSGDNPDSIMYELEFLALLLLKYSIAPNQEATEVTEKAYQDFLKDHTAEFAIALSKRIREGNAGPYFLTVAFLLETFIKHELKKIGGTDGK
jgi:TorA maturation chaperone TorD